MEPAFYDSDDELDCDMATRRPQHLAHQARLADLKRRLLDRLGEILAPVKNSKSNLVKKGPRGEKKSRCPQPNVPSGPSHAAAAILVEDSENATIYVAKNNGPNEEDKTPMETLSNWIQHMATTGQRPAISTDQV